MSENLENQSEVKSQEIVPEVLPVPVGQTPAEPTEKPKAEPVEAEIVSPTEKSEEKKAEKETPKVKEPSKAKPEPPKEEQPKEKPQDQEPQVVVEKEKGFTYYVGFALLFVVGLVLFFTPGMAITFAVNKLVALPCAAAWIFSAILSLILWIVFKVKIKGFKKSFYWYLGLCVLVAAAFIAVDFAVEGHWLKALFDMMVGNTPDVAQAVATVAPAPAANP